MLQGQIFKKPQWLQNLRAVKATPVKLFITSPYQSQLSFQLLISSLICPKLGNVLTSLSLLPSSLHALLVQWFILLLKKNMAGVSV